MGSLFKPPKYTPPPAMERSNKLLDERDARADASREKSEKRKLAAKARARRGGGRLLYSQDRITSIGGWHYTLYKMKI